MEKNLCALCDASEAGGEEIVMLKASGGSEETDVEGLSKMKNENGSVLVVALIILVLLTLMGLGATTTSTIELEIAGNEKAHKIAFFAADAGIEAGRAALNAIKTDDSGNWDNLLAGNQLENQDTGITTLDGVIDDAGGRMAGQAVFTLAVADNDDLDGNTSVDTDNTVILTSTATYGTAQSRIQAHVRYAGFGDEYDQEHYDAANTGVAAGETAVTRNKRWSGDG
jgi:Tfp pilus assembly protein PilX